MCKFILLNASFSYFAFYSTHFAQVLDNFAQMCVCTSATFRNSVSRVRDAKRKLFYGSKVWAKVILPKKGLNYHQSNLRQNIVNGPKYPNSEGKNAKKQHKFPKYAKKNYTKNAKLRHNSVLRQNRVKFGSNFTPASKHFTHTLFARSYIFASLRVTCHVPL